MSKHNINKFRASDWYNLGRLYDDGDKKKTECFENAVKLEPDYGLAWHYLGCIYSKQDNEKTASFCNNKACEAYKARLQRFKRETSMNQWKEKNKPEKTFRQNYDVLKDIDNKIDSCLGNLAALYSNMNQHQNALDCYELLLDERPNDFEYNEECGMTLYKLDKFYSAIDHLRFALEVKPDDFKILFTIARAYDGLDNSSRAKWYYKKTVNASEGLTDNLDAFWARGDANYALGEYRDSTLDYEKVLKIDPKNDLAWRRKADAHIALKENKEANHCYDQSCTLRREKKESNKKLENNPKS